MVNISVLEKFGVDVSAFQRIEEAPTSSTILNIRPNGERPALHLRGASDYFLPPSKEKFNQTIQKGYQFIAYSTDALFLLASSKKPIF